MRRGRDLSYHVPPHALSAAHRNSRLHLFAARHLLKPYILHNLFGTMPQHDGVSASPVLRYHDTYLHLPIVSKTRTRIGAREILLPRQGALGRLELEENGRSLPCITEQRKGGEGRKSCGERLMFVVHLEPSHVVLYLAASPLN